MASSWRLGPRRPRRWRATVLLLSLVAGTVAYAAAPGAAAVEPTTALVKVASSGHCLDVRGDVRSAGVPVIIWDCHGKGNQRWSLDADGRLRTFDGALCLVPARATAGAEARTAACSGATGQSWRYTESTALLHEATGLCLDVFGAGRVAGTQVIVWKCHGAANQRWSAPVGSEGAPLDVQPPSPPQALRSSSLTCSSVALSWTASSDDVAVTAYDVFHDGQLVRSVQATTVTATVPVVAGVSWGWYVNARDAAGNVSQASPTLVVTPPDCAADTVAPTPPTRVTATADGTSVTVRWQAATDDVGVRAYQVLRDGTEVGSVIPTEAGGVLNFIDSGLAPGRTYAYTVVAGDAQGNRSTPSAAATTTTGGGCRTALCSVVVAAQDDDVPWGLAVMPDGEVLYSRRDAHDIVALDPATGATRSLGTVPGVSSTDGEGGLMGIAVAPTFAADRWLYVMHTTSTDNRVVRIRYAGRSLDTRSTQVLVRGILRNKYHNGGRLRFGPDGMLYAATGDAQNGAYAQALTGLGALNGKILRMTPTGGVPAGNPFDNLVWSYGHRNPQGLAFDAQGRLWAQEFGNSEQDETNLVQRGGNHGWPQCEGTVSQSGGGCGAPGLVAPKATYAPATGSCSGIAVVSDALWVACARGARLYRHTIIGTELRGTQELLVGAYGRLRTVEPAADGGLWLTTTNLGDKDSVPNNSAERILRIALDGGSRESDALMAPAELSSRQASQTGRTGS